MVFIGGSVLANIMKDHPSAAWITKLEYAEQGSRALEKLKKRSWICASMILDQINFWLLFFIFCFTFLTKFAQKHDGSCLCVCPRAGLDVHTASMLITVHLDYFNVSIYNQNDWNSKKQFFLNFLDKLVFLISVLFFGNLFFFSILK